MADPPPTRGARAGTQPSAETSPFESVPQTELGRRSVRGGAVTLASQALKFLLTIGSTIVLARLLTPADFGLIAMVAPITGFLALFKDLGLSVATVQRDRITPAQVNALFWVNVGLSVLLVASAVAVAPLVGSFYGDDRLVPLTMALAAPLLLGGVAAQHQALLQRRMRFTLLAAIDAAALAVGAIAGIALALLWESYWALVAMTIVTSLASAALTWTASGWRPGRPAGSAGVRSMLEVGGGLTGFNVVNHFARNADDVLVGRVVGADALGLYSKAYSLLLLPIWMIRTPISGIALSVLSRVQGDAARFRTYVRRALEAITFLSMPLVAFCAVEAQSIILLVLGDQWLGAVGVFRILAFAALIQSFNVVTGWVYTSLGRTVRWFRWGMLYAAVVVTSFVLGLPWGIEGVALAYTIAVYIMVYPSLVHCFRDAPVRVRDVAEVVWRPLVAAGLSALMILGLAGGTGSFELPVRISIHAVAFGVGYLLVWVLVPGGRRMIADARAAAGLLLAGPPDEAAR